MSGLNLLKVKKVKRLNVFLKNETPLNDYKPLQNF